MVPKKVFFTKGVGKHKDELQSFELALRSAGIERCNLVYVSSILPPHCQIVTKEEGVAQLQPGQITYCVMSRNGTQEPNRLIGASVGSAVPKDEHAYGYISEHHSFGIAKEKVGDTAERLAATMLARTLGLDVEVSKSQEWSDLKKEYIMSGLMVKTMSTTQTAEGDKDGMYTTVIAAAVFIE
jgi:arginine decarboxylase